MKIYNFRLDTGNALKNLFVFCISSNVVNILRLFVSSVSIIFAILLFSICAINVAGITKPTSLFLFTFYFPNEDTNINESDEEIDEV